MPATTEETSKPLDSAEISRMFEAMRNGTFQAAPEAINQAKSAFTAKSLFDIARAATREELARTPAKAKVKPSIAEIEDAEVLSDEPSDLALGSEALVPEMADALSDGGTMDLASEPLDDLPPVVDALPPAPAPELGPRPANLEELKAEWGRGFSAGEERARADLSATVEARIAVLDTVIEAFRSADAVANLRLEIIEAVKELASARAGAQIDEMPEAYLTKIEDLVDRIRNDLAQPRLRLNPEDIAAVKPYLDGSETLASVTITADPDLARGDLELSTDGLRYADRLAPKAASAAKLARKKPSAAVGATENGTGPAV